MYLELGSVLLSRSGFMSKYCLCTTEHADMFFSVHPKCFLTCYLFQMVTEQSCHLGVILGNANYHEAEHFLQIHLTGQCMVTGVIRTPREGETQK